MAYRMGETTCKLALLVAGVAVTLASSCDPLPSTDPDAKTVVVTLSGDGDGTVTSEPPGIECVRTQFPAEGSCDHLFDPGTIRLTADPDDDSDFAGWSGDAPCAGITPSISFPNDQDRTCDARFDRKADFELSVDLTGGGSGTVTSTPGGIACAGDCDERFAAATAVTLTATPGGDSDFIQWLGACAAADTTPTAAVTMDADRNCIARFEKLPVLTVSTSGTGFGTVTSDPAGITAPPLDMEAYPFGQAVILTAVRDPGSTFVVWTGSCVGSTPVVTVTMGAPGDLDYNRSCDARFDAAPTGPFVMIYDDVEFDFNGDHFALDPGNTRALVSPRTGTGLYEVNLENLSDVFVSDDHLNMCTGAPVVADDPAFGRMVFVFGIETTQGCVTQYPPLDFAVGLFNVGSSTGDVATFNGLGQYARAAFSVGALHIQTVGAVSGTTVMLAPGLTVCPRYLWIVGTTAFITTEEGTPGTSTEACAATAGLYRVDLVAGTVTGSLLIGDGLRGLTVTADGSTAYVSDYVGNAIHVINAQTMQPIRTIPVAGGVVDVALSDDESLLVAALYDANAVALVDLATDQVVNSVPTRGTSPTRFRPLGSDRFALLDFGSPGSGIPSRFETFGIVRP